MKIKQIMQNEARIFESIADISCRSRKESFCLSFFIEKELKALKSTASKFLIDSYLMDVRSLNLKDPKTFESELTGADLCEFLTLTNRTPNGALMSRVEVDDIFSLAQREVIEIIDKIGLMEYISEIHLPISFRLTSPSVDSKVMVRPYSASKKHTEIWCGHPNHAVISIPIFGDFSSTGVSFFLPSEFKPCFFTTYNSYDEAIDTIGEVESLPFGLLSSEMILYHAVVVHNTFRKNVQPSFPRLTADLGIRLTDSRLDELVLPEDRKENYFNVDIARKIGKEIYFESEFSFFEKITFSDHNKRKYAAKYKLKNRSADTVK